MTRDQLDAAVADTGVERLRWLTSDANPDPESREDYRRLVREKAEALKSGPPPSTPAEPNPHQALLRLVRSCPHAGPASCGCNSVRRCSRLGRDVSLRECLECVNGDA